MVCFSRGGEQAVWQSSVGSHRVQELPHRRWKHGRLEHRQKIRKCCDPKAAGTIVNVLLLSNPAVPFDPGSREITLSLMYQDDIIKIGHVFWSEAFKGFKGSAECSRICICLLLKDSYGQHIYLTKTSFWKRGRLSHDSVWCLLLRAHHLQCRVDSLP